MGTGLAANFGWPVALVRMAFVVLVLANGLGVILYMALWVVMPLRREAAQDRDADFGRMLAFGAVAVGAAAFAYAFGWSALRIWIAPLLVLGLGLAILWQQSGWSPTARGGRFGWARPVLGIGLVVGGIVALVVGEVGWFQGVRAIGVLLLFLGGAALLASPWLVNAYTDLAAERRTRIREQERMDIAAHVHDSVLQTLTLIQANAADSDQVSRLARTEERRLRSWLYAPVAGEQESLAAALTHTAAKVESEHDAAVEVVNVGDAPWSPATEAIVAAAGEAMVNAAKHAGPRATISVYCEAADDGVSVFVRDRGPGFDPAAVAADRRGIRESIVGRMERAGGSAEVVGSPGGTEVRLRMEREV